MTFYVVQATAHCCYPVFGMFSPGGCRYVVGGAAVNLVRVRRDVIRQLRFFFFDTVLIFIAFLVWAVRVGGPPLGAGEKVWLRAGDDFWHALA